MTPTQLALVRRLADGNWVSGEALGDFLGVSRAAVWKQLQQLESHGVTIRSGKGRGYCIPGGLDLLDRTRIMKQLSPSSRACLTALHLVPTIDSTSSWLMRELAAGSVAAGAACLAEQQTQGRGRRGRAWSSPFARNLYCSVTWEFEEGIAALDGLSLAVGVAVVQTIERLGISGARLKWPNDLLWFGRKLGGILLEVTGEASGNCQVVVGVGLNVSMPQSLAEGIDQPWVDLSEIAGEAPSRSLLAGRLLDELVSALCRFQAEGFAPFRAAWEALNAHGGQEVTLLTPARQVRGVVQGISEQGGLRLLVDGEEQLFLGGEISLRSTP